MSVLLCIFSRSPFDLTHRILYGCTLDCVLCRRWRQLTSVAGMLYKKKRSNSQCSHHEENLQLLQLIINTV